MWGELLPNLLPPFFKLVGPIYDIPFSHFIIGMFTKFFLVAICFLIAWKMTGSLFASTVATILMFAFGKPLPFAIFVAVANILIVIKHKSNIKRLLNGSENKVGTSAK